jgi:hypothetical protein
MKMLNFKNVLALSVIVVLTFSVCITTSVAQEKTKAVGKQILARVKMESIDVGDVKGHSLIIIQQEGVYNSTGKADIFDGGQIVVAITLDLVNGNGPFQAYSKLMKNGDMLITKSQGVLTTTSSAGGTPVVTSEGTFTYMNGTGQFQNIKGNGTFKGRDISSYITIGEVEGEYFFQK